MATHNIFVWKQGTTPFAATIDYYRNFMDHLNIDTVVEELKEIPKEGFVFWDTSGDPETLLRPFNYDPELIKKTIVVDVSSQNALKELEKYRFVGAIDSLHMSQWNHNGSTWFFGLKKVFIEMGTELSKLTSHNSENYALGRGMMDLKYLETYRKLHE